jgi:GNAT superfamily N-acetyltransferase
MDAFEKEDLPMDIIIWAAQNGISGRMGAFPIDGFKRYRSAEERSKKPPTFRGKPWKDVKESLGGMPWPFATQRKQYPKKGEPGLSYFRGEFPNEPNIWVDCLLWRDEKGKLVGILNHYPMDMTLEKKGNVNLFIDPKAKRQGIASALLSEAIKRYNVDLRQQRYSAEGAAFVNEFVRRLPENSDGQISGRMATRYDKDRYSSEDVRDAILDVYSRGLQVSDALEALRNEYDILMDRTDWTARMTRYRKAGILDSFRLPNKKQTARKIEKSLTQKFIDKRKKEIQRLIKTRPNLTHKEIAEIINRMPIPDGVNVTRMTTASVANILRKGA